MISRIDITEEQHGFRRNRSTIDAIFIVRQMIEKSIEYNKPIFMCFIDLTQAFDRVRLSDVINIIRTHQVNANISDLLQDIYTNNKIKVRVCGELTEEIQAANGIRQGDSLSPALFNLIMNEIITTERGTGTGYTMGREELKITCYADDAVIFAENEN